MHYGNKMIILHQIYRKFYFFLILSLVGSFTIYGQLNTYNVLDWDAVKDGSKLTSSAIQGAIDAAHKAGGGEVYIPPGTYLCTTLYLKDNVTLTVSAGATILASPNIEAYPQRPWKDKLRYERAPYHLIHIDSAENVTVQGMGVIDGNGSQFWKDYDPANDPQWIMAKEHRLSTMFQVEHSRNVTITDVTMIAGGAWTLHVYNSNLIKIDRINIENNLFAPNGDGIDISGSSDVTVSNCNIRTCDDGICLKTTGDSFECKRIAVINNIIECSCAALKIGNESFRDISQVTFTNNIVYNASRGLGIYAEGGGTISDITVSNLIVDTKAPLIYNRPVQISLREKKDKNGNIYASGKYYYDAFHSPEGREPAIRNILIQNLIAQTEGRILITAEPGRMIENLTFRDVTITYPYIEDPVRYKDRMKSMQFPHQNPDAVTATAAFVVENTKNFVLDNLVLNWPETETIPEDWMLTPRIANGTFDKFYPDYSTARQASFSAVYGKGLEGGYIRIPLAESSDPSEEKIKLESSSIKVIELD